MAEQSQTSAVLREIKP